MNRIITLLTLFFIVAIGYAQCPDPIADAVQYVCPSSNSELDDLSVTVSGTAVWYDDDGKSNALPATTPIIDGKTYYVANNDGTCESNVIPIRVYIQSVEFVVSPNSCLNLGKNIFFVEQGELNNPVEIEVLNHDGNPHTNKIVWSPMFTNEFEYYLPGFGWNGLIQTSQQGVFQYPPGLIFNHISKTLDPFELLELDVNISGDSCSDSQESITIIAGGIEFKELCYGVETTLENIKNYYATLLGNNLQFYDVESEGASLPLSTIIEGGDIFYIELDQLNCQTRIPVIVKYKTEQPYANTKYYACTQAAWSLIGIGDKETLHDINVSGTQLKWYDSSMNEITANPKNITLEHGDIFYVSNIVAGCESEPLKIEVFETDCGCLLNGNFEDQSGTVDFRDIKIFQNPISSYSINWNVCATDLLRTNQIVLYPPESPSVGSDTYTTFASIVSKGSDPTLEEVGVIGHPRTSPLRGESNFSLRLNRNIRNKSQSSGVVYLEKEFVAGEVFSFDFSMVMENPTHHIGVNSEPYFQVQILDQSNRVIESRCVTASLNDCILHDV